MWNLRSKFGKNLSTNYVTFLSTDAGRTDGRTVYVILYSVQCICIALHWTDKNVANVRMAVAAILKSSMADTEVSFTGNGIGKSKIESNRKH